MAAIIAMQLKLNIQAPHRAAEIRNKSNTANQVKTKQLKGRPGTGPSFYFEYISEGE